jgi:hypothetical protein
MRAFDVPVELSRLLKGVIRLSDGVRLIACTRGLVGVNIARRWPMPVHFEPGEYEVLEGSARELFGFLSRGDIKALYFPPNGTHPVEIDSRNWSFHGYDAVGWDTSNLKTGGAPIDNIKIDAGELLGLIAGQSNAGQTSRQKNKSKRKTQQGWIADADAAVFPNGVGNLLSVKERDARLNDWIEKATGKRYHDREFRRFYKDPD